MVRSKDTSMIWCNACHIPEVNCASLFEMILAGRSNVNMHGRNRCFWWQLYFDG